MTKAQFIGIDAVNHTIKKQHLSVGGTARKIKGGHVSVSGVAKQFWSGGIFVLYNRGSKPYPFTLGLYSAGAAPNRSATDQGTYIRLYTQGKSWSTGNPTGAKIQFDGVDLTNYSKIHVVVKFTALTAEGNSYFDVQVGKTVHSYGYIAELLAVGGVNSAPLNIEQTITVDISSVTGNNYIIIRANNQSASTSVIDAHVYEVYLEP